MDAPAALTPAELATALRELLDGWTDARVDGVALLDERDDLLLFLSRQHERRPLQIAPGGPRARVCPTHRRFAKRQFATGPRVDRLDELFADATLSGGELPAADERRLRIDFTRPAGPLRLHVELFGARGLWAVCDAADTILALSRLPNVAGRELRPGARYAPPPPVPLRRTEAPAPPLRFDDTRSVLAAIDELFTAFDRHQEDHAEELALDRALQRATKRLAGRLRGAVAQVEAADRAAEIRSMADMLLAYGATLAADADELRCPHPERPDDELVIPRDPRLTPHAQAQALYKKARKHEDGRKAGLARVAELEAERDALDALRNQLDRLPDDGRARGETLRAIHDEMAVRGLVERRSPPKPDQKELRLKKLTGGENYRRFTTREGLLILVGRDNRQNDRLTTRVARGNDVWLHVGRGYAGSHVLLRVDKGRSPSLESLLDAATLAIHFSKVRGAELEEVIYCPARQVRKPKGMPAGKVVPARTKTLRVRREPDRLERLLSSPTQPGTL